jgi:hypothetical protein
VAISPVTRDLLTPSMCSSTGTVAPSRDI